MNVGVKVDVAVLVGVGVKVGVKVDVVILVGVGVNVGVKDGVFVYPFVTENKYHNPLWLL